MMAQTRSLQVVRVFRFMRLFGATMFSVLRISNEYVHAIVAWEDDCDMGIPNPEDAQEVRWTCSTDPGVDDALTVGEYAYDAGWVSSDKMRVNREELQVALGWDAGRVSDAVNGLLRLRSEMIDDGERTDAFQLHL